MNSREFDVVIVGAGPVGLMCAYLGHLCGLKVLAMDKSLGPLEVGRADALNARSLQLFEIIGLFDQLYPLGKPCNTSSIWSEGRFQSRQSSWWDALQGCFHKHFLMLGQSFVEKALDEKLKTEDVPVFRGVETKDIQIVDNKCRVTLSNGDVIQSKYLIGADGSRSFVRETFQVPFEITRPELVWAVIDGVLNTDFPKVPEIIVFQAETSDVAWIPREGNLDRFYVRMDTKDFEIEDALVKIKNALKPHHIEFKDIVWFSRFSVKESVAEKFMVNDHVFLAGDACHIHSVNGGQGLNTGLADAFNLMWKLNMAIQFNAPASLLQSYEGERKPIAKSVVETSAELVRATKFSATGSHAKDYIEIVERRSGHITGMGIRYGDSGFIGKRLFDFEVFNQKSISRIYSLLDYTKFTLLVFGELKVDLHVPEYIQVIEIRPASTQEGFWTSSREYSNQALLVRPDSYIAAASSLEEMNSLFNKFDLETLT